MKSNASISNHRSEVMLERSGRGALIGALVDRALCSRTLDIGAGLLSSESSKNFLAPSGHFAHTRSARIR